MAKSFDALKTAYDGQFPELDCWRIGPLIPGSHATDTMPCQLIDGPGHAAKIEVHGDYCDTIAKEIVAALNSKSEEHD